MEELQMENIHQRKTTKTGSLDTELRINDKLSKKIYLVFDSGRETELFWLWRIKMHSFGQPEDRDIY